MLVSTNGDFPKYLCFENVPGLLSSNNGGDFREVMDEIASLGFISDPNIIDAADFGVAQRRKRIFIACVNRKFYDPTIFADEPKVRDKRMGKAVAMWGGETFYGIVSRPHTPVRQCLREQVVELTENIKSLILEQTRNPQRAGLIEEIIKDCEKQMAEIKGKINELQSSDSIEKRSRLNIKNSLDILERIIFNKAIDNAHFHMVLYNIRIFQFFQSDGGDKVI